MRTLIHISIPVETGNAAARAGTLGSTMQKILQSMKVEAAYFTTTPSGERGGFIVCDLQDNSQIPAIAEPFFLAFNARLWFHPVMNAEDLAKAVPGIDKAVKEYGGKG
jgi:hypothetical protein